MGEHVFSRRRIKRLLGVGAATAGLATGSIGLAAPPAQALTSNLGYACAYWSNVSLFGGAYGTQGCGTQTSIYATANSAAPSVTLPSSGASQSAADNDGAKAVYGPAVIFSSPYDAADNLTNSGQLSVSTGSGTVVSSQATSKAVGPSPFWTKTPTSWQTAPDIGYVKATCTASSPTTKNYTTTIHNGVVDTSTDSQGYPTSQALVPENPPPGYRIPYTIDNVGDYGMMVFNEPTDYGDYIQENASHMYMQGATAFGDVIISQVKCGHV